jgi:CDP-diacylglycerol---serine O-phosphatidyltransferase
MTEGTEPLPPTLPRKPPFQAIPLRLVIPNCITLLSLCAGLTGVRIAFEGRFDAAVIAVGIAAILDGLDGRVARLMKGASRFGAELDSLADFVCFGCAPALILYSWTLHGAGSFGWLAGLVMAIAAALRLARFNVMLDDPTRPDWQKKFFVGMPAPAGALCALLPMYLFLAGVPVFPGQSYVVAIYVIGVAFMMVSRIPTYAGKQIGLRIPGQYVIFVLLGIVALAFLLVNHTFETLAGLTIAYWIGLPFGVRYYRSLAAADAQRQDPGAATAS